MRLKKHDFVRIKLMRIYSELTYSGSPMFSIAKVPTEQTTIKLIGVSKSHCHDRMAK